MFQVLLIILCPFLLSEGFAPSTLIKTPRGYQPIGTLQVDDEVICYDIKTGKNYSRPITAIKKSKSISYFVRFSSTFAIIGHDQLIYFPTLAQWIPIQKFLDDAYLRQQTLIRRILPFKSEVLISLSVDEYHNFYVTEDDILVHNAPAVFIVTAAETIIQTIISGATFTSVLTYLGIEAFREHKKEKRNRNNYKNKPTIIGSGGAGRPPEDPNDPYFNKDKNRFQRRDPNHHITNKEAREVANELGYIEVKNPPFDTHGELAFKKGSFYITPDNTCHSGGYWKLIQMIGTKDKRIGTYDKYLTIQIGK